MRRHAFAVLLLAAAIPCAVAAVAEPAGISAALRAPSDEQPAFLLNAQGVQIYTCKAGENDPKVYRWTFVAPEATLLENGTAVGHHGAGPTWELTSDRTSVGGTVRQRQDGGAGNIPWLLLVAKPVEGSGRFAGVTSIQRVSTKGGVEPADACDESKSGQEVRVPYTADYYFYKRK
jgi:Protein of unknown function (DUF3455)